MYEDLYDLTDSERLQVREILADMSLRGGRLAGPDGRPVAFRVLRGRRFLVCDKGSVWRFAPAGAPQIPGQVAGVVRRNSAVEMWTGRWRKTQTPEGKSAYAKCLVWVSIDDHINGHPGISKLGWYQSEKGFKHPLAEPHAPVEEEIASLEGRAEATTTAVYARMQAEGLNVPDGSAGGTGQDEQKTGRRNSRAS